MPGHYSDYERHTKGQIEASADPGGVVHFDCPGCRCRLRKFHKGGRDTFVECVLCGRIWKVIPFGGPAGHAIATPYQVDRLELLMGTS